MGNFNSCYCAEHAIAAEAIEAHEIHSHDLQYDVVTTGKQTKRPRQREKRRRQPSCNSSLVLKHRELRQQK